MLTNLLRKIAILLLCSTALLATNVFAEAEENVESFAKYIELQPNQAKTIKNHMIWRTHKTCEVRIEENEAVELAFQALQKRIVVNGIIIDEGYATSLIVRPGDKIELELNSRARLGITNHGQHVVNLRC